jgi:hypothetical protein
MVYNGYGSDSGARSYSSYPSTDEVSDSEMQILLEAATQRVQDDTAKDDWDSGDTQWELVNLAASLFAGELAVPKVSRIDRPSDRVKELEKMYQTLIKTIVGNPFETENKAVFVTQSAYTTYPLNPDVEDYESVL